MSGWRFRTQKQLLTQNPTKSVKKWNGANPKVAVNHPADGSRWYSIDQGSHQTSKPVFKLPSVECSVQQLWDSWSELQLEFLRWEMDQTENQDLTCPYDRFSDFGYTIGVTLCFKPYRGFDREHRQMAVCWYTTLCCVRFTFELRIDPECVRFWPESVNAPEPTIGLSCLDSSSA